MSTHEANAAIKGKGDQASGYLRSFLSKVGTSKTLSKADEADGAGSQHVLKTWMLRTVLTFFASTIVWSLLLGWSGGAVISALILVHEFGHWMFMKAYGLKPKPPLLVPPLGGFVTPTVPPNNAATAAWVGLAGPLVGTLAAILCLLAGVFFNNGLLIVASFLGCFINGLQLIPVKPFDGGHVVAAISKFLMIPGLLFLIAYALFSQSAFLGLIAVFSIFSMFGNTAPKTQTTLRYAGPSKTVAELENEFVKGTPERPLEDYLAPQLKNNEIAAMTPATAKQKWAIGAAFFGLGITVIVFGLASVFAAIGNPQCMNLGVDYFSREIAKKDTVSNRTHRGFINLVLGNLAPAKTDYERAIKLAPNSAEAYYYLAVCEMLLGGTDKRVESLLAKSVSLSSLDPDQMGYCASAYLMLGKYDEAIKISDKCDSLKRDQVLATAYERKGMIREASEKYRRLPYLLTATDNVGRAKLALWFLGRNDLKAAQREADIGLQGIYTPIPKLVAGWCALYRGEDEEALDYVDSMEREIKIFLPIEKVGMSSAAHRLRAEVWARRASKARSEAERTGNLSKAKAERQLARQGSRWAKLLTPINIDQWEATHIKGETP